MNPRYAILALAIILGAILFVVKGREDGTVHPHVPLGHDCSEHGPGEHHHPATASSSSLPSKAGTRPDTPRSKVVTTASGLQYEVLEEGTGPRPGPDDRVEVHYVGELSDGTVFDSSHDRGAPTQMSVSSVIAGWQEGLQLMRSGGIYQFTIPAELAYGESGAGGIVPPNATLSFKIELLRIFEPDSLISLPRPTRLPEQLPACP